MLHYVIKAYSYNFIERNKLYDKQPKFQVLLKKEPIQEYLINSNNICKISVIFSLWICFCKRTRTNSLYSKEVIVVM